MKTLAQTLVGLLLASGVCVKASGELSTGRAAQLRQLNTNIILTVTPEAQCQGSLVQQPSAREVVVWVNEKGDRIDPNSANKDQPPAVPQSEKHVCTRHNDIDLPSLTVDTKAGCFACST